MKIDDMSVRIMQGIISHYGASNPESNAKLAVDNALALTAELEKRGVNLFPNPEVVISASDMNVLWGRNKSAAKVDFTKGGIVVAPAHGQAEQPTGD